MWTEIEDNMVAKHARKRQITELKYGGFTRLSVGKFWKHSNNVQVYNQNAHVWNVHEEYQDYPPSF